MNFMHRPSGSRLIIRQSSLKSTLIPRPGHPGCKMCQITTVVGLQVYRNEPGEEIQTPYVLCAGKYIILGVFEVRNLRSQIVTSGWGGLRYAPMAFTEQGVAMLSSVLRSDKAIMVNIQIMRVFTKVREMLMDNLSLRLEIESIKKKITKQDKSIELVFNYLDELLQQRDNPPPRKQIGFKKTDE